MKRTFEQLEPRRMLAIGPPVSDPSLTITLSNTPTVRVDGAEVTAEEFSFSSDINVLVNPISDQVPDYVVDEDKVLVVNAANGVSGGLTGVVLVAGPTHGVMVLDDDGAFIYAPDHNYYGPDHFIFSRDGTTSLVSLLVTGVSDPPTAVNDVYDAIEDITLVTGSVFDNDYDPDGDPLSIDSFTQPANGVVVHNGGGIFSYTPDLNFNGTDVFTYVASDGNGGNDSADVTIEVAAVNDSPTAADDDYTTQAGKALGVNTTTGLLSNDFDVDGDPIAGTTVTSEPGHGAVTVTDSGALLYRPDLGYIGPDSFEYTISDGLLTSEPAVVTIDVTASNDPIARSEVYLSGPDGITIDAAMGVLANDSPGGLVASIVVAPSHGVMVLAADGSFTYTPEAGFAGADPFVYRVTDGVLADEARSAIWVEAAKADMPSPVSDPVDQTTPKTALGGGSFYDVAFHQATRRPNWEPVLPPEYVDRYYGDVT